MQTPVVKDLVLIGGGHSHLAVLKRFGMRPLAGVRLTLISRSGQSPYSGMLPGLIAGHYKAPDMHFDLRRLADFAGGRCMLDEVVGLDLAARCVLFRARPPVRFDVLSINTGSTPSLADLKHRAAFITAVKPIDEFNARWQILQARILATSRPLSIGVVGAGAGGVELVLAIRHRLQTELAARDHPVAPLTFHLFAATAEILPDHNPRTRATFRRLLAARGVQVHLNTKIIDSDAAGILSADGQHFALDEVLWVTAAAPAPWFRDTGLALDAAGYIRVGHDLGAVAQSHIFAAGDCATIDGAPRPKSGVYAVRQGPILADNLQRACLAQPLRNYHPQAAALSLISTGDQYAVANRGPWSLAGTWVWRWKDWIDRRFMQNYQTLPAAMRAPTPGATSPTLDAALAKLGSHAMRCAGCGSKVGAATLKGALGRLRQAPRPDVLIGLEAPDDAAVTELPPNHLAVHTIDGFRAFASDPYVFGQITAAHCLSDIFAMGATPQSALAYVTLPLATARTSENDLALLLAGVLSVLALEHTALVGGHTNEGLELSLALAVNGHVSREHIRRKAGAKAGDALILTKPLGTGVLLAGAMRGLAAGAWLDEAFRHMARSNGDCARALAVFEVHALTDVTGFGLAGHLSEMLRGGTVTACIALDALPPLSGALELITQGVRSTLHAENEFTATPQIEFEGDLYSARSALLYDPQTSGGLLIALPATQASACVTELCELGYAATVIGRICDLP